MGCDIHLFVEVKNNGKWELSDVDTYDLSWRNYRLFAMLANVRNGRGFAGCDTGDALIPISPPKGVPEDASDDFKDHIDSYGYDGHSHSYLTVQEILDYDLDQTVEERGFVTIKEYMRWKESKNLFPNSCCGDVWGPNLKKLTQSEADILVNKYKETKDETLLGEEFNFSTKGPCYYVKVAWTEKYRDMISKWLDKFNEIIVPLGDPNDVRLVFFFDS